MQEKQHQKGRLDAITHILNRCALTAHRLLSDTCQVLWANHQPPALARQLPLVNSHSRSL